jgi:ComEC/Rec2-related protein
VLAFFFLGVWFRLSLVDVACLNFASCGWPTIFGLVPIATLLLLWSNQAAWQWTGAWLWGSVLGGMLSFFLLETPEKAEFHWNRFEVVTSRKLAAQFYSATVELSGNGKALMMSKVPLMVGHSGLALCIPERFKRSHFPGDFDEREFYFGRGIVSKFRASQVLQWPSDQALSVLRFRLNEWRSWVKSRLMRHAGHRAAGWMVGLTTGDKTGMPDEDKRAFSSLGLAHLTAVSGFHVGMVMAVVLLLMSRAAIPLRWRNAVALPVVWAYVLLCGAPASAVRAVAMVSFVALADVFSRRADGWTMMSLAGTVMLTSSPYLAFDVGTKLSFLATGGILMWFRCRAQKDGRHGISVLVIPVVATLFTAPVAWSVFGRFPVAFLPANVLATPVVLVTMIGSALHGFLPDPGSEWFGPHLTTWTDGVLWAVRALARTLPAVSLPMHSGVVSLAGWVMVAMAVAGMVLQSPFRYALAGVVLAVGLLRFQQGMEWSPTVIPLGSGAVGVTSSGRVAVFAPSFVRHENLVHRKTRSFLKRVSTQSSETVVAVGKQLSLASFAVHICTAKDTLTVFTLPPSHSGLPSQRRSPTLPSP